MMSVLLATEDELSEAIGLRLLREHKVLVEVDPQCIRQGGNTYLKKRMDSWKQMASWRTVFLLTDLDRVGCPSVLINEWMGEVENLYPRLIFRVAVREVEAWLLADHEEFGRLIGYNGNLPRNPDELDDPKRYLLSLAEKAPRKVRTELIVPRGSVSSQGLGYNRMLSGWVQTKWSPARAAARSPSLHRARLALSKIASEITLSG